MSEVPRFNTSEEPKLKVPDFLPEQNDLDKIVDKAIELVDSEGYDKGEGYKRAIFMIPTEHQDGKISTLSINVPNERESNPFSWRAELVFGNQDAQASTHLAIRKDGTVLATNYDGTYKNSLDEQQIKGLLAYFEDIQGSLIPDLESNKQIKA